ncbi:hypothetical protein OF83DRAFT_547391 [Amylostereum chailletii]|nr:hypothetical protein OF83DRAFT_547391 [Amylostereum chailletii]
MDQPSHRVEQDGVYTTDPETSSVAKRDVDDWEWRHDGFMISCDSHIGSSSPMAIPSEKKSCSKIIGSAVGRSLDVPHGELMLDHTARDIKGSVTTPSERRFLHDHVARGFCDRLDRHMSLSGQFSLSSLSVVGQMSRAGGSINTVVQSGCFIALSSDTVHGEADDPAMREVLQADVHNRQGTLQVNADGSNHVIHDHRRSFTRKVPGSDDYLFDKYYAVLAVAFDPNRPSWMISASTDGQVAVRDVKKDIFAANMCQEKKLACQRIPTTPTPFTSAPRTPRWQSAVLTDPYTSTIWQSPHRKGRQSAPASRPR